MFNPADKTRIAYLESRVARLESVTTQLLDLLSHSGSEIDRMNRMQALAGEMEAPAGAVPIDPTGAPETAPRPLDPDIRNALATGDRLEAIRMYRERNGASLQQAMDALGLR